MGTIGTLPGDRLAGLSADLFHKLQSGSRTLEELALFLQGKNPFAFERNEHGHVIITVTGLDATGAQEIERLTGAGYRVSNYARSCLTSTKKDGYDVKHRLVAGAQYKVALVPGKEIERDADRTTEGLRKHAAEKYGYGQPLAGVVPRLREVVSDKQMEELGFWYVAALHDPIKDSDGDPSVLCAGRNGEGRWVGADWGGPRQPVGLRRRVRVPRSRKLNFGTCALVLVTLALCPWSPSSRWAPFFGGIIPDGSRSICGRPRLPATEPGIHASGAPRATVLETARCLESLKKRRYLVRRARRLEIANSIQPGEYSMGGGLGGASHKSDDDPNVLYANRNDEGRWVNANWDNPGNQWNTNGAFAFLVPATLSVSPLPLRLSGQGSFVF
jgi:hypothetical protein